MTESRVEDGRKIAYLIMNYIRKIAVRAVEEKGYSPEVVMDILRLNRSYIYNWLRGYHKERMPDLETSAAHGIKPKVTKGMKIWLRETVLKIIPKAYEYDTHLWNCVILAKFLQHEFGGSVS